MARQDGRQTRLGFGLFEREAALDAAEEALDLLTGLTGEPPSPPERVPAPRDADSAQVIPLHPDREDSLHPAETPLPRGGVLAYAAPAGLGKTTLLAEIRRRAAARGCTVLSARGGDQE
ncbi:hypothetical protein ACFFSH_14000 [Streptomyces filamentosus]|uniref:Uncharacterized protein n=2 Tax=Streptomyces filamentosus TaxID=67294 RepID=A0A919EP88_STRFL|nr:hypothetical protein [Streptomyces filamentosus]GHG09148.1 hypothetical protein GCM10017667_46770 [Streptomyces filamentosus]